MAENIRKARRASARQHIQVTKTNNHQSPVPIILSFVGIGLLLFFGFVGLLLNANLSTGYDNSEQVANAVNQKDSYETAEGVNPAWGKRKKIQHFWVVSAQKIAQESGDEEAIEVADLLQTHGLAAITRPDQNQPYELLEQASSDVYIAMIPLMTEDKEINREYAAAIARESLGGYAGGNGKNGGVLVVKDYPDFSEFGIAMLILHEGTHVRDSMKPENPSREWANKSETRARMMTIRIHRQRGGIQYETLAQKMSIHFLRKLRDGTPISSLRESTMPISSDDTKELYAALKVTKNSEIEAGYFMDHLVLYACLLAIEQFDSKNSEDLKEKFLDNLFGCSYDRSC